MQPIDIGPFTISPDTPPFFVAELGICHGGKLKTALELTEAAARAGVQCIKTETFDARMVFSPEAKAKYMINGQEIVVSLQEHMKKYQLSLEEHATIKRKCDQFEIPFMSTAHDFNAIDFLVEIGAAAIKIASPDLVHIPLLRYAARTSLPIFLDTGAALQFEIEIAVKTLKEAGCNKLVINHNPDGHPAPAHKHDLLIIPRLQEILDLPVGLADHYAGYEILYAATALGAMTLEKPISKNRFIPEPEHSWSISIADLPQVLKNIAAIHASRGQPQRELSPKQQQYRDTNRMACLAAKDLRPGEIISLENICFGRPRKGIGVEYWDLIAGRKLVKKKKKHEFIQWGDFE